MSWERGEREIKHRKTPSYYDAYPKWLERFIEGTPEFAHLARVKHAPPYLKLRKKRGGKRRGNRFKTKERAPRHNNDGVSSRRGDRRDNGERNKSKNK